MTRIVGPIVVGATVSLSAACGGERGIASLADGALESTGPLTTSAGTEDVGTDSGTSSSPEEPSSSGGDSSTGAEDSEIPANSTPPAWTASVVDLSGVFDRSAARLGALNCAQVPGRSEPSSGCLRPFRLDPAGPVPDELGTLTFVTVTGASIYAAAGGVVDATERLGRDEQTGEDVFRVRIRLSADSAFWHEYLRLQDLTVGVGDVVEPGSVLGVAGGYLDPEFAKVSFGIVRQQEEHVRLCPTRYATPTVLGELEAALSASTTAFGPLWRELCETKALACVDPQCNASNAFVAVGGDIDRGRRDYQQRCARCHGSRGEGDSSDAIRGCRMCTDQATLERYIGAEMPPAGSRCTGTCAQDIAAFILWEFED